jgi:hypothetical protein
LVAKASNDDELTETFALIMRAGVVLEGGQTQDENWVVHELMRLDPVIRDLIEVYEKSISANSPKIVTFNTLAKGVAESWADELRTDKRMVADQINAALRMVRSEVPEWGTLPFRDRREERSSKLYSQAIVHRALLRVLAELHRQNEAESKVGDWNRWRSMFRRLKTEVYTYPGQPPFKGEFLSRDNPVFYANRGASIYQMNKGAREEQERLGDGFVLDPKKHLTVQNTRLSLDAMYGCLSTFLGYRGSDATSRAAAAE